MIAYQKQNRAFENSSKFKLKKKAKEKKANQIFMTGAWTRRYRISRLYLLPIASDNTVRELANTLANLPPHVAHSALQGCVGLGLVEHRPAQILEVAVDGLVPIRKHLGGMRSC